MKIGIIGATGKLGGILLDKLIAKDYSVVAIVRNKSKLSKEVEFIEKDIFNLTTDDMKSFDVVINAFNANINNPNEFITSTEHLITIFKNIDTRLLFAGGAGILLVDEKTMLVDTPAMPKEFLPVALAEVEAYKLLSKKTDFNWTYMAPAAIMDYEAPNTGNFKISGNKLGVNSAGDSFISYADYADAFIEQIQSPDNHKIVGVYNG